MQQTILWLHQICACFLDLTIFVKILVYSVNFAPEPTGIGKYSGEMAAWLAERGHTVRVVAAPPYYPRWKCAAGYAWPPYRREQLGQVDVWRAPIWVPNSPGGVSRIFHLFSFALSSLPIMLGQVFWRPNLVLTIAPAMLCAPVGVIVARLCGARAWLHLQDFEIDVAFRMGLLKGKLLQRSVLAMERWLLRRFDRVSTISNRMVERLIQKKVPVARTLYFPNWVDTAMIDSSMRSSRYRSQLEIGPNTIVALFSGTLGGKQGLMVIPEVAKILKDRVDVMIVICGDGVMKSALLSATDAMANVRFLPLQPLERLGELLCMADIHLLPQSLGAADLVLPSKLSGMMASGRPVIATCQRGTELDSLVSRCGLVVPPKNAAAMAAAILQLTDDAVTRQELGRKARAIVETEFERDAVLNRVFMPVIAKRA